MNNSIFKHISWKKQNSHHPKKTHGLKQNLVITAAILVLGGCSYYLFVHRAAPVQAPQAPSVIVSEPLQKNLDTRINFLGQFAAIEHLELRAQVGGTLTEIHFKDGDIVKKGTLLFTIDPTPYEIKYAQALAQAERAQAQLQLTNQELKRAVVLKRTDAGSTQNVEQKVAEQKTAQAFIDETKALVRDAKFDLDHTKIVAPFTGRIGTHMVSIGNLISGSRAGTSPTTLLATLVSLDPIYLNFDMSEQDYLAFARQQKALGNIGIKVSISLSDEKTFTREGTLNFIDNAIERSSGTIHARATVTNKDLLLIPGAFARVRLAYSKPKLMFLVPDSSVLPDESNHIVLILDKENTVMIKTVEIGDLRGGLRIIKSGLNATDKVIIQGITSVHPGEKASPSKGKIKFNNDKE